MNRRLLKLTITQRKLLCAVWKYDFSAIFWQILFISSLTIGMLAPVICSVKFKMVDNQRLKTTGGVNSLPPPKLEHFVMTEKLGQGTYASVYKAYRKVRFIQSIFRSIDENISWVSLSFKFWSRHVVFVYWSWSLQRVLGLSLYNCLLGTSTRGRSNQVYLSEEAWQSCHWKSIYWN